MSIPTNPKPDQSNQRTLPLQVKTSTAAITSMVFGIMSPIVLCTCWPTIVTSLFAVGLGHYALVTIKRGRGSLLGKTQAIVGLCLGYPFLLISIIFVPQYIARIQMVKDINNMPRQQVEYSAEKSAMSAAESDIVTDSGGVAYGNSPEARQLARGFASRMKAARNLVIEDADTNSEFITYCRLNEDSVCFLVHVPQYRKFEDDAKELIAEIAWGVARKTMDEESSLHGDYPMGVGMKGLLVYGAVMNGSMQDELPPRNSKEKGQLEPFFED